MAVSDYSTTPASNTLIAGTDVAEGCSPAGVNDAIRQIMADIKAFYELTALKDADGKLIIDPTTTSVGYPDDNANFALDVSNGEIVGINALIFSDTATSASEGVLWPTVANPTSAADYAGIWAEAGGLMWSPVAGGTEYAVYHEDNVVLAQRSAITGETAPSISNLNGLTNTGHYSVDSNGTGAPDLGFTYDANLQHIKSDGQSEQILTTGGGRKYFRVDDGSGYSSWDRLWTDTYNDVPTFLPSTGAVGSYAILGSSSSAVDLDPGDIVSGSSLRYAGFSKVNDWDTDANSDIFASGGVGARPSGSWRCMGFQEGTSGSRWPATLFLRVS